MSTRESTPNFSLVIYLFIFHFALLKAVRCEHKPKQC